MAEQLPKLDPLSTEAKEKQTDLIAAALSSEDKTEGNEETGYCSAPWSSDVPSGAESMTWTSDDHVHDDTRAQPGSTLPKEKQQSSGIKIASKSGERKPKLGLFKRPSPVKNVAESGSETGQLPTSGLSESLVDKEGTSEDSSTRKYKTRSSSSKKTTSGLPKFVSCKQSETSQPSAPAKLVKTPKSEETSTKSPSKRSSGIPKSRTSRSPKGSIPLPDDEQAKSSENKEKTAKNKSRTTKSKILRPFSKSKSPGKKTSPASKQSSSSATDVPGQIAEKSPVKPKKSNRFSLPKFKSPKKDASTPLLPRGSSSADETQSSDSLKPAPTSQISFMSKSMKQINVSGRQDKNRKKSEEIELIEEDVEPSNPDVTKGKDKSREYVKYSYAKDKEESDSANPTANWRPQNPLQEGGFLEEDMIACMESSIDDTPTEISTLSESSGKQRGSRSRRRRTVDSASRCSSLGEEVIEGASGFQDDFTKPQLQRQTNVEDEDMEVFPEDVFLSPKKKSRSQRKEDDDK